MRNHFLPRAYLSGFATDVDRKVVVQHDLVANTEVASQVVNLGLQAKLYPDSLELFLANEIEAPANRYLDRIRQGGVLILTERVVFARYLVTLLQRTPAAKEKSLDLAKQLAPKQIDSVHDEIQQLYAQGDIEETLLNRLMKELEVAREKYSNEIPDEIWFGHIDGAELKGVMNALVNMRWSYFQTSLEEPFVTTDNPVWYPTGIGIGHYQTELLLPISPTCCLMLTWHRLDCDRVSKVSKNYVTEINTRLVTTARRFVYSYRIESWVYKLHRRQHRARLWAIRSLDCLTHLYLEIGSARFMTTPLSHPHSTTANPGPARTTE